MNKIIINERRKIDIFINFIFNLVISKMSSGAKITFGNNPATSYNLNTNPNFAYQSGDKIASSYSPYSLGTTGQNAVTSNSYSAYEPPREVTYGNNNHTQPYSASLSSPQVVNPVGVSYQSVSYDAGLNVAHVPPATKVTFGGKSYTPSYAPTTSTYQYTAAPAPAPVVQYQTYQTYQQPVQITSQPIRTEVRQEVVIEPKRVEPPRVEAVPEIRRSQVKTSAVQGQGPAKPKKQKSGCPKWLWPLLGILALLALIIGLLFGLGVFGKIGGKGTPTISTGSQSSATVGGVTTNGGVSTPTTTGDAGASTGGTTVTTGGTTATTEGTTATTGDAGATTGTTTGGTTTGVTSPTGYTVIEETTVLSKDNTTATNVPAVTIPTVTIPTVNVPNVNVTVPTVDVPTVNVTVPTVDVPTVNATVPTVDVPTVTVPNVTLPNVTVPTVTLPNVTVPTVTTVTVPTVTIPTDDTFAIDPVGEAPIPVTTTSTITTTTPTTTTTWSNSVPTGTTSNWSTTGVANNAFTGTTFPTGTLNGYGSNPSLTTTTTTSSSSLPVTTVTPTTA